jgi:hypothetical protein
MVSLYFIWGGFFVERTWINQVVFNFAVFYPVGFVNGYFQHARGPFRVFRAAVLFNVITYLIAIATGETIPLLLAGLDFITLFLFITLGIRIGNSSK